MHYRQRTDRDFAFITSCAASGTFALQLGPTAQARLDNVRCKANGQTELTQISSLGLDHHRTRRGFFGNAGQRAPIIDWHEDSPISSDEPSLPIMAAFAKSSSFACAWHPSRES